MVVCGCCYEKDPKLDDKTKAQRWAYWFAGFGVGPDTANGAFCTCCGRSQLVSTKPLFRPSTV